MEKDTKTKTVDNLLARLGELAVKTQLAEKRVQASELENEMSVEGFWTNQVNAQNKTKQLAQNKDLITRFDTAKADLQNVAELIGQPDSDLLVLDIDKEIRRLTKIVADFELVTYLGGKYDPNPAIVTIHAGQGGTEAMDWAEMLQRMYIRFGQIKNWSVEVVDMLAGDEAGIKSTTMLITGDYAYGYLKNERGTHRLVRQSPFNADKLRQTSFALVEVLPQIEENGDISLPDSDLEWDFFHASSHGGQNVQKVSTAVRLRHKPTGIVVVSQSERYQERNREIATNLLRAKLWEVEEEKRLAEKKDLKGEFRLASWGNQIRSYVLHPYKMVKDLRTDYEENDPFLVLDGELTGFIEAELKHLS